MRQSGSQVHTTTYSARNQFLPTLPCGGPRPIPLKEILPMHTHGQEALAKEREVSLGVGQ